MNQPLADRAGLAGARRVVVKVGSSSLTAADGRLSLPALHTPRGDPRREGRRGQQIVLVSSGAIAAGITPLGLPAKPKDLATAQATASVGQGILVARYTEAFTYYGQQVGQVLLTAEDLIRRTNYANAQRALERLLTLGVVPIVNENDTVATDEIRFGDNDRLAALVSHLVRADALVLLTDVEGLYDGPPSDGGARLVRAVTSPADLAGVEVTARGSDIGTGGMVTKARRRLHRDRRRHPGGAHLGGPGPPRPGGGRRGHLVRRDRQAQVGAAAVAGARRPGPRPAAHRRRGRPGRHGREAVPARRRRRRGGRGLRARRRRGAWSGRRASSPGGWWPTGPARCRG